MKIITGNNSPIAPNTPRSQRRRELCQPPASSVDGRESPPIIANSLPTASRQGPCPSLPQPGARSKEVRFAVENASMQEAVAFKNDDIEPLTRRTYGSLVEAELGRNRPMVFLAIRAADGHRHFYAPEDLDAWLRQKAVNPLTNLPCEPDAVELWAVLPGAPHVLAYVCNEDAYVNDDKSAFWADSMIAAYRHDVPVLRLLARAAGGGLTYRALLSNPDCTPESVDAALSVAIASGAGTAARALLLFADTLLPVKRLYVHLLEAVVAGELGIAMAIQSRQRLDLNHRLTTDIDPTLAQNDTVLFHAVRADKPLVVDWLLRQGADPFVRDVAGLLPIVYAQAPGALRHNIYGHMCRLAALDG